MYRVLIVDDEEMIVEGLKFLIGRGVPDCEVAGIAYDGEDGLQKALTLCPDIILTDIRMYQMDGIEMIRRLREEGLHTRYIVLSGYAEFSYARQALQLGVEDYITKPVEEEELYRTFAKVCASLAQERQKEERVETLYETVDTYSRNIQQYRLRDFLEGRREWRELKDCVMADRFFRYPWFLCAVFEMMPSGKQESFTGTAFDEALQRGGQALAQKFEGMAFRVVSGKERGQRILIFGEEEAIGTRSFRLELERLRRAVQQEGDGTLSAGIGLWHKNPDGLRRSLEEALCALNYRVINGPESMVCYDETGGIVKNPVQISQEDIRELERCMDEMDDEGCARVVEKIFCKIGRDTALSPERLQMLAINLILSGTRKMPFMQLQMNEYLGRNILSLDSISKFRTVEQLKNWIINILKGMNELMLKQNVPEKRDVVEEAKAYIAQNFQKEITLTDISEKFYINPYYFSQLFKKKTGETYQNYLTGIRISRARKLLEETDLKLYEISSMVGYADANHFGKVFEKYVGVKPQAYRRAFQNSMR